MSHKNSVEHTAIVSCEDAAKHLETLADGLRRGRAVIETGDKSLSLDLGGDVKMELEAEIDLRKGKGSIEIAIGWHWAEPAVENAAPLNIAGADRTEEAWAPSEGGDQPLVVRAEDSEEEVDKNERKSNVF
jgi:amphi-Trp domain-containing protein